MGDWLSRLTLRTAGESHGRGVLAVLEGLPRGIPLDLAAVDAELRRRQGGAGRGGRQRIEDDHVEILTGLRAGVTLGSPLTLWVANRDASLETLPQLTRPRPGHADLAGCFRYGDRDIRATLERASARETAARVAAGAVAAQVLAPVGCQVFGFVRAVHASALADDVPGPLAPELLADWRRRRDGSRLYTLTADADAGMLACVQAAAAEGDSVGGVVEVHAVGLPGGLGSHLQWSERLDARLAGALMSIPAVKGVEVGLGFEASRRRGSQVHDPVELADAGGLRRASNHAGGLEGGTSNGEDAVVRAAMKPISTLRQPLPSVDLARGVPAPASYERADVCAVSACSVVAEAMVAIVLLDAVLGRIGGETLADLVAGARAWRERCRRVVGSPDSGSSPDVAS
ncbi:MAG: chorismate synthase [Planctomycetota bacterium]